MRVNMKSKYLVTTTSNNKEETLKTFEEYEDALKYIQMILLTFHKDIPKELSKNKAELTTEIGINIVYQIKEEFI
jgi:hypothetical protein